MNIVVSALFAIAVAFGTSAAAANIVEDGSFAQGYYNPADNEPFFTSDYQYVAPAPDALIPETLFTIASDPNSVHPYWIPLPESGPPLLIVNGATAGPVTVWQEDVPTVSGQTYEFSASAANICCNATFGNNEDDPSLLSFEESTDDFTTYITLGTILTHPAVDAGQFATIGNVFTASGPIELRVVDDKTGQSGNDFAISNISISAAPEPSTWVLMIGGIAMIGGALRFGNRRRTEWLAAA